MLSNANIHDDHLQKERNYWLAKLAGELPQCGLPLDWEGETSAAENDTIIDFALDPEVREKMAEVSRGKDLLLFVILVSALDICLHKYTGLDDIVIGSAVHDRREETAFSNHVLLLRDRVEDSMSVHQLLDLVRNTLADAYGHQRFPFARLKQLLGRENHPQQLFRVAIVLNGIHDPQNVRGLGQDITLEFSRAGQQLAGRIHRHSKRLRLKTCEQFARNYCQVLREMLFPPDKTIAEVQLFSRDQRQQLVHQRNRSRNDYPREKTIPALIEEQVTLRPTAPAVSYEGRSLSYQQLNAKANQFAQYLRERGAGPEVSVGISIDRSLEMIIGLLAILKAGAAYVPVDLDYPPERQEMIIRDSGLKLLLVSHHRVGPWPCGVDVIHLSPDQSDIAQQSPENPDPRAKPENLAYIMYTSGSTGIPKGVGVPHRAVVRLVKEANYVELGPQEKILQFAPLNFDASTFEIWGSLLNGGELIVMSAGGPSLDALGATVRDKAITTVWLTSGLFDLMVDHCLEDLKGIRQLLAGGDVISVAHAEKYLIANPHATLINGYGPTENTTFTCCGSARAGTVIGNSVPIGTPVSNTQVQILDCNFDPVPVGVVGELCAGGDGLARSYVNDPELTAEKFVPNPFCESPGQRLYRTGDYARYCWDGLIEFVGRVDQQVKIRGYRIELREIEAILEKHESVQACVVLHEESDSGDGHLTAYVVARDNPRKTELRRYLEEKLPAYMIPSELVKIKKMPLTDNGKIDRAKLRTERADLQLAEEEESYVAPGNELEKAIAEVWKDVLTVERVGMFDNFFDLGGHSVLAMKICARMNGKLTCKVRVTDLLLYPTIHSLSRHLALKRSGSDT